MSKYPFTDCDSPDLTVIPMVIFVGGWVLLWRPQVGGVGDTSSGVEADSHHGLFCFPLSIYRNHL